MFNSRLLILILGTPVTALAQQRQVVMPADSLVPGTYQVRICRAPCDPANDSGLLVKGTVVLLAHGVPRHLLPSTPHEDYYHRFRNACFFLEVVRNDDDTYAGIFPVGMTGWDRDPKDSLVQFSLYWSPDARYWVKVRATGVELVGRGQSHGPFLGSTHPIDSVYAQRAGEPDQARCVSAAKGRRH